MIKKRKPDCADVRERAMRMVKIQMLLRYSECLSFTYRVNNRLTILIAKESKRKQRNRLWIYDIEMQEDVEIDPLKVYIGNAMVVKDGDSTEVVR